MILSGFFSVLVRMPVATQESPREHPRRNGVHRRERQRREQEPARRSRGRAQGGGDTVHALEHLRAIQKSLVFKAAAARRIRKLLAKPRQIPPASVVLGDANIGHLDKARRHLRNLLGSV